MRAAARPAAKEKGGRKEGIDMKLLKRLGLLTLCLMLGICGAAAEEAAPEKLSGIDMILIRRTASISLSITWS